jgi:TolB-like protein
VESSVEEAAQTSVFVCYSHDDEARVYPIIDSLKSHGVDVWYDQGIRAGSLWRQEIGTALERATHVLFFISRASLQSAHCDREVEFAIDNDKTLIPVFLDSVELTPALRVALGRVQALHATRLDGSELLGRIRNAVGSPEETVHSRPVQSAAVRKRSRFLMFAIFAVGALAMIVGIAVWQLPPQTNVARALPTRSIVVTPFGAPGGDPAAVDLAEQVTEQVLDYLAKQRRATVMSRASRDNDRASTASYALEGSVRVDGSRHRVSVKVMSNADRVQLWSGTFEGAASEIADTARVIALAAFGNVDRDVLDWRDGLTTRNADAFGYFLRAKRLRWSSASGDVATDVSDTVIANLDKAIELDSEFVPALAWRGSMLMGDSMVNVIPSERLRAARQSIELAVQLQPDSPTALRALANLQAYDLDLDAMQRTLERLQRVEPDFPHTYESFMELAMLRGRLGDALRYCELQIEADGANAGVHWRHAWLLRLDGQLDRADASLNTALRLAPNETMRAAAIRTKIELELARGDEPSANRLFEQAWTEFGQSRPRYILAIYLPRFGRESDLRQLVAKWESGEEPVSSFALFDAHYGLAEYDTAIVWLRRALEERIGLAWQFIRLPNTYPEITKRPGFEKLVRSLDSLLKSH